MTFYIDVIFIENIIMNYIIIFVTGLILKKNIKPIRIFLSSLIGALYAIMSYISEIDIYKKQSVKFLLSVVMVYIAFDSKNIKMIFKDIIIFYLTSFCFGGAAYYLLYYISPEQIVFINGILKGDYPIKIVILGAILGFFVIYFSFKIIKNKINKKVIYYNVEIYYKQKYVNVKTMLDTGNFLIEPVTGFPVIIVETDKIEKIINKNDFNILKEGLSNKLSNLSEELKLRYKIIPFSSIGKNNGMLIGFRPDYIKIYDEYEEDNKKINNVIVGIYNNKLSKGEKYEGLIGLELLEN